MEYDIITNRNIKGQFIKGHKPLPFTTQHKKAISNSRKGIIFSKETIDKMKKSATGRKLSDKTREKMSQKRKGEKHWNWKGGITSLVMQIRNCKKNIEWRTNIFLRDNFTCVLCKIRSQKGVLVYLEADHYPKLFSTIFHENQIKSLPQALKCKDFWDTNNGRTLCHDCHKKNKKYYGNQYEKQIIETVI